MSSYNNSQEENGLRENTLCAQGEATTSVSPLKSALDGTENNELRTSKEKARERIRGRQFQTSGVFAISTEDASSNVVTELTSRFVKGQASKTAQTTPQEEKTAITRGRGT